MEKIVFDNFFHHLYDSKDFLNNSWKTWKSCQNQLFPRLKPFWRPKSWKELVLTTFSTICMIPKTSLTIRGKRKKLAWPTFSTTQAVLEAQIVEKVGQANFLRVLPILSMLEEEPPHFVLRTRGASCSLLNKREALFPT